MKAVQYYCNQMADLIEQGYDPEYAVSKIQQILRSDRSSFKINRVMREFKYLYGHDVFYYDTHQPQLTEIDSEELFYEFNSKNT